MLVDVSACLDDLALVYKKMRIAFIVNCFPSLSQTFILSQITGLIDQGHTVDIYAETTKNDTKVHQDVIDYNLLDSTYYFNRPGRRSVEIIKALWIILLKSAENIKFLQLVLEYSKCKEREALPSRLKVIYIAKEFIDKPEYDVIQCHFGPNGTKGALVKKMFFPNSILATTFHGYELTKYLSSERNLYSRLFEMGDLFLPISEHWKRHLINLGCSPDKIQTHHMGVNIDRFTLAQQQPSEKSIRLITIARLSEKKGIEYGIRAVQKLKSGCPNIKFEYLIVGEGPLRPILQALIEELDLEHDISLLGWRQQQAIVDLLSQSQILLAHSVTASDGDQEGIPVVLMEAMAMGLPVVSTWHSGIPELVKDGISGFLVPEKDVEATAKKLALLINSSALRTEMGLEGRKYVKENFNVHTLNYQLSDLFQKSIVESRNK